MDSVPSDVYIERHLDLAFHVEGKIQSCGDILFVF